MTKTRALTAILSVLLVATAAHASVPELDPSSASMSIALLVGGLLVLNGRRPRR